MIKKLILLNITIFSLTLAGCTKSQANCYAGPVSLKWNYVSDYYFLQADITNDGKGTAKNVIVYYYYLDQGNMRKYTNSRNIGSIDEGDTVTFESYKIYESMNGYGITNYGISEVKWQ